MRCLLRDTTASNYIHTNRHLQINITLSAGLSRNVKVIIDDPLYLTEILIPIVKKYKKISKNPRIYGRMTIDLDKLYMKSFYVDDNAVGYLEINTDRL